LQVVLKALVIIVLPEDLGSLPCLPSEADGGVSCKACGLQFSAQALLETHRQREHPQGPQGRFCCTYCPYSSNKKDHITRHEKTHTCGQSFVCEICAKVFKQAAGLAKHLLAHKGEKPYKCADCGRQFADSCYFTRHRRLHSGNAEGLFPCPHCGKKCLFIAVLKRHLLTHTDARPYACPQCGKKFRESGHLRRHESVVHNRRYPLHCSKCGKGVSNSNDLRSHVRTRHSSQMSEEKPQGSDL
ncbi:zinc finger protein ZIPIC-like, partial [Amblyomma americanum]